MPRDGSDSGMAPGVMEPEPVSDAEFAALAAAVGPFEREPRLAVALSGGPDSMALCLLADAWARRRGGRVIALTVDHRLRPESAAEAATVGQWMRDRAIEHHILPWSGARPRAAIQAEARAARYDLLSGWCRRFGVLHLALAHQLEDQAETFLMRLSRGSGTDGLAGMSAVSETPAVRVVRPLLAVGRARLTATLRARRQAWIEDPSNRDPAFARVRARQWLAALAWAGCGEARLGGLAEAFAARRIDGESRIARLLARACSLSPAGYVMLDPAPVAAAARPTALGALSRVLATVGGGAYPASRAKVEALLSWMADAAGPVSATLARCRCLRRQRDIVVCRESRHLPAPLAVAAGRPMLWDGRFAIEIGDAAEMPTLGALGGEGWAEVVAVAPDLRRTVIPHPARLCLPALRDSTGIVEVPFLGYRRPSEAPTDRLFAKIVFSPRNSLSSVGFCLASRVSSTI